LNNPYTVPKSNRGLTIFAWVVVILISTLPDICFDKLTGGIPTWLLYSKLGLLLVTGLTAFFWKPIRPLRNFLSLCWFSLAPMLATLEPVGGNKNALWMAAYFFGGAHYFGTPGGIIGGLLSIFMGWILGKGMVETRGFFWAWWIHWLSDIAIFIFLTITLLK
jgi:hypothetical protein